VDITTITQNMMSACALVEIAASVVALITVEWFVDAFSHTRTGLEVVIP